MKGNLERELNRLNEELKNTVNSRKNRLKTHKQGDSAPSDGAPNLQIETREMETQRESNRDQLISRRQHIITSSRSTELFSAAEQQDREKTSEILTDFHATAQAFGEIQQQALKLIDRYTTAYAELEKNKDITKTAINEFGEKKTKTRRRTT